MLPPNTCAPLQFPTLPPQAMIREWPDKEFIAETLEIFPDEGVASVEQARVRCDVRSSSIALSLWRLAVLMLLTSQQYIAVGGGAHSAPNTPACLAAQRAEASASTEREAESPGRQLRP